MKLSGTNSIMPTISRSTLSNLLPRTLETKCSGLSRGVNRLVPVV